MDVQTIAGLGVGLLGGAVGAFLLKTVVTSAAIDRVADLADKVIDQIDDTPAGKILALDIVELCKDIIARVESRQIDEKKKALAGI